MEYIRNFFYGLIERYNNYLLYLDTLVLEEQKKKQLVPVEDLSKIPKAVPHLVFKEYDESSFPYNLNGKEIPETENSQVNRWLQDFAFLNIDAFEMIVKEQTLPDATFIRKRYYQVMKKVHPDAGGSNYWSTRVNVAKDELDRLYEDPYKQITLFQSVFQYVRQREDDLIDEENDEIDNDDLEPLGQPATEEASEEPKKDKEFESRDTAQFVILYLVGAGLGTICVFYLAKKRKKK